MWTRAQRRNVFSVRQVSDIQNWLIFFFSYFELELNDFGWDRYYRVAIFDHDLFSFEDVELNSWPVIVITNPKDAQFLSNREPLIRQNWSTHIRVFIFTPGNAPPTWRVNVFIDNRFLGIMRFVLKYFW